MTLPILNVVGAALLVGNRCLVGKRPPGGSGGERWEFPGGKIEIGESPEEALRRELCEELGIDVVVGPHLARGFHQIPKARIVLDVFQVSLHQLLGPIECRDHTELRFIEAAEVPLLAWAEPDLPALSKLIELLGAAEACRLPPIIYPGHPE